MVVVEFGLRFSTELLSNTKAQKHSPKSRASKVGTLQEGTLLEGTLYEGTSKIVPDWRTPELRDIVTAPTP